MIQILIASVIIGAFYFLISHIASNGKKEDTIKEAVKGAMHMVVKVLIPIVLFLISVIAILYFTGWANWIL